MNMNAHMDSGTTLEVDTSSPFVDALESIPDNNGNEWGESVVSGVRGREIARDWEENVEGISMEGNLLTDLPDACIGLIVLRLSPKDVARSACMSRAFREMLESDFVWEQFLPVSHAAVMARASNGHRKFATTKATFEFLCSPLLLHPGTQAYWLDRGTGGVCYSVAARGLGIVWVDDSRYWDLISTQGSRWPEVAFLKSVCWFHVSGELKCLLPPGTYTLSWRVQYETRSDHVYGWATAPTKFHLAMSDGSQASNTQRYLTTHPENAARQNELENLTPVRLVEDNWLEYDAGEILVTDGEKETELIFSMIEIQSGSWKSGINLDGIVLRPTSVSKFTGRTLSVEELGESSVQSERPPRGIRNGVPRNGPFGVPLARGMFPMRRGAFGVVRDDPVPDDAGSRRQRQVSPSPSLHMVHSLDNDF